MRILCFFLLVTSCVLASLPEYLHIGSEAIIGLDLCNTHARMGVYDNTTGKIEIMTLYVAFSPDGELILGELAMRQIYNNSDNAISNLNRIIGLNWNDPRLQNEIKHLPFKIFEKNNKPHLKIRISNQEELVTPEKVMTIIIKKLKERAEEFLSKNITHAVMAVPFDYTEVQRNVLINAGAVTGLEAIRIIDEPKAAAFSDYVEVGRSNRKNIFVYNIGENNYELALLKLTFHDGYEVISTCGNRNIGGESFSQRIVGHFQELYKAKGKDISHNRMLTQKLKIVAEKAMVVLSKKHQVRVEIKSFFNGEDFSEVLTRTKFEELNMDLFQSTIECFQRTLNESGLKSVDIDNVLLVGASSRIPKIRHLIIEHFLAKIPVSFSDSEEAVVYGAAKAGATWSAQMDSLSFFSEPINIANYEGTQKYLDKYVEVANLLGNYSLYFSSEPDNNLGLYNTWNIASFHARLIYSGLRGIYNEAMLNATKLDE